MTAGASLMVERTERGDDMFAAMATRTPRTPSTSAPKTCSPDGGRTRRQGLRPGEAGAADRFTTWAERDGDEWVINGEKRFSSNSRYGHHGYLRYDNVRVPADHLLGGEGQAFVIAQTRLGGGRVHHAMRTVAQVHKAPDKLSRRARSGTHADDRLFTSWLVNVAAAVLGAPTNPSASVPRSKWERMAAMAAWISASRCASR